MSILLDYLKDALEQTKEMGSNIRIISANHSITKGRDDESFSISYEDKIDIIGDKLKKIGIKKIISIEKFDDEIKIMKNKIELKEIELIKEPKGK